MFWFEWAVWSSVAIWWGILLLPWQPWRIREVLEPDSEEKPFQYSRLTVLIPARNEADVIGSTLQSLAQHAPGLRVVVVNDNSTDATDAVVSQVEGLDLTLVQGKPLPKGWSGKLWALEQGVRLVETPKILLLDADIQLHPGMLAALLTKMDGERLDFVSIMARLRMEGFWEKLLMPAFVYFFKLLYPFSLANNAALTRFAAAAGGCILLKTEVLGAIGGFASLKNALIDDCTLAQRVKRQGYRTWIGLSRGVVSQRRYESLEPIWHMVARTAFTQLRYSVALLGLCTLLMVTAFGIPLAALFVETTAVPAIAALGAMMFSYWPTLRYYRLSFGWGLALPVIGALYLMMVWDSAVRFWQGERSRWKGRVYAS